jgi:hypothetical protein
MHEMQNHDAPLIREMSRLGHATMATLVLCIAIVGYTHQMPEFGRFFAGLNDFLPRYTQARMVGTDEMYSIDAGYKEQETATGMHIVGAYHDRLPWQALLMAPVARLPYLWAYWIWIALHFAAFAVFVVVWLRPRDCVLWGATFLPLAASLIVGQDALLIALGLAGVLGLAARRHDFAAGLLLALCAVKPHLLLLVPVALLAHRRWGIVRGAVIGSVALLIGGAWAAGLDWPLRLLAIMKTLGVESGDDIQRRPSLFQFGMHDWTVALALLVGVVFGYLVWRSRNLEVGIAVAVVGGILIAPHTAIYDLPLLLIALPSLPLPSHVRWLRILLFTPFPYWALLNGAPWNAVVPVMLLVTVGISVWRSKHSMTPHSLLVPCRDASFTGSAL